MTITLSIVFMLPGFSGGNAVFKRFSAGTGTIWLNSVRCLGTEVNIMACSHQPWGEHNCGHSEDAGCSCGLAAFRTGDS